MAQDAGRFFNAPGPGLLPLYEAKLIHQFDHRWASYKTVGGKDAPVSVELTDSQKSDPTHFVSPRYFVNAAAVEERLAERWGRGWLLTWRSIARNSDVRTIISCVIPRVGVGHKLPLVFDDAEPVQLATLSANLNSFVLDYSARQKVGGTNVDYFLIKQFPVLTPSEYDRKAAWQPTATLRDWIADRVLELTYTAWDLQPFAQDIGYDGPPFHWDPDRRFEIRCELDAAYFHLYEIDRDDVDYIMSTFPIVKRKDIAAHGTYRTRDRILEIYDAMATGEWVSSLSPPPADQRAAHDA